MTTEWACFTRAEMLVLFRSLTREMQREISDVMESAGAEAREAFIPIQGVVEELFAIADFNLRGHYSGDPEWDAYGALVAVVERLEEMNVDPQLNPGDCTPLESFMHYGPARVFVRETLDVLRREGDCCP